jgi:hypothetical protein
MNKIVSIIAVMLVGCASAVAPQALPADTDVTFIQQYNSIRSSILTLPESLDKTALLLLLDSAGTRFANASSAADTSTAWKMLGRVAALLAGTQGYVAAANAVKASSVASGVLLAVPLYLTCAYTSYPTLHGYVLDCPATQYERAHSYWCQGLQCVDHEVNQ